MISSLQLDITRRCQQECVHCYNSSGPAGTHGTMTAGDWAAVIGQAAALGIRQIQFIGGEPTLHPALPALLDQALGHGLHAEIYTNMVRVPEPVWQSLRDHPDRVSLATSWYGNPAVHQQITGRRTHDRIARNIARATAAGIPLRAGIIDVGTPGQHTARAARHLRDLGVPAAAISTDRVRRIGRAAPDAGPDPAQLCGHCGTSTAAVLPDGTLTPCPLSWWLPAGDIRSAPLAQLLAAPMTTATRGIPRRNQACAPNCGPNCSPMSGCVPWAACKPR
jgi:MoaA/NifB/PqqE/SkfB family radical SAM enzyme